MAYEIIYTDELYHHGIKGQKCGFRRFQNPDGSYTSAGRSRYGVKEGPYNSNKSSQSSLIKKSGAKTDGYSKQKMPGKVTNLSEDEIKKQKQKILLNTSAATLAVIGSGIITDILNKEYAGGMGIIEAVKNLDTKEGKIAVGLMLANSEIAGMAVSKMINNYNELKKIEEKK